jgi:hypothetical protein
LNIAGVVKDIDVLIPFAGIIPDAPYDKEKWMKEKEVGKVPKEAPCSNEGSMSPRTQKLYKKQQVFVCVCLCWGIILQNCKETCGICKDFLHVSLDVYYCPHHPHCSDAASARREYIILTV